jgi:archaellum component FlaF (FlaF/FlaG flagellin family)
MESLAVADFNGDGKLDIVVANLDPTVSVFLGNGDGTFQSPVDSDTTAGSSFVVAGDFNGDGKPDIAVADRPFVSVLLGNGDGTFQSPIDNHSYRAWPTWLAVADFNNDHKLDVVVAGSIDTFYSHSIGILLGNGDGTLQPSLNYAAKVVPGSVAAGDLNGDGDVDVIVGYGGVYNGMGGVDVFLGNGDGSLQPPVFYKTTGDGDGEVIVSDLNLDGKLDVATTSSSAKVSSWGLDVLWGNGDGTLHPAQFFASGQYGFIASGDLNGDHLPDFAFASVWYGGSFPAGVTTMLNTGVASFSPASPVVFPLQLVNTTSQQTVTLTNNGTTALSIRSMKVLGKLQVSNTCGSSLPAGATCTISIVFGPKTAGTYTGLITLMDSASSRPQFIELSGSATAIRVSPTSLAFGDQKVGTQSAPQAVTVTNAGSTAVRINGVYISGPNPIEFSRANNCVGHAIEPGGSCKVEVRFKPIKTGAAGGGLNVLPQSGVGPPLAALSGTGT